MLTGKDGGLLCAPCLKRSEAARKAHETRKANKAPQPEREFDPNDLSAFDLE